MLNKSKQAPAQQESLALFQENRSKSMSVSSPDIFCMVLEGD